MEKISDPIISLVKALRCLPGVGPKSALRMVYHLLGTDREKGFHLAHCIDEAMSTIRHCERCNNYTTTQQCDLCLNQKRDSSTFCIVESPADIIAIEQSNAFQGSYFVLMGKISPLDGIGADDIGIPKLRQVILNENVKEVILALSPTIEGQATCHFIREILRDVSVQISQLAQGIPSGGELEYLDSKTITHALRNRAIFETNES